jgi:hypothetical protein
MHKTELPLLKANLLYVIFSDEACRAVINMAELKPLFAFLGKK